MSDDATEMTAFASRLVGAVLKDPTVAPAQMAELMAEFLKSGKYPEPINILATMINGFAHTEAALLVLHCGGPEQALKFTRQVEVEAYFEEITGIL